MSLSRAAALGLEAHGAAGEVTHGAGEDLRNWAHKEGDPTHAFSCLPSCCGRLSPRQRCVSIVALAVASLLVGFGVGYGTRVVSSGGGSSTCAVCSPSPSPPAATCPVCAPPPATSSASCPVCAPSPPAASGSGCGGVPPPIAVVTSPPPAVPPPWYAMPPPGPFPANAGALGYGVSQTRSLAQGTSSGLLGRLTLDKANNRLWVASLADGLFQVPLSGTDGSVVGAPAAVAGMGGCSVVVMTPAFAMCGNAAPFSAVAAVDGVLVYNLAINQFARSLSTAGVAVGDGVYDASTASALFTLADGTLMRVSGTTGLQVGGTTPLVTRPACAASPAPGVPCYPLLSPAPDGAGRLFVNAAMQGAVLKVNATTLGLLSTFPTAQLGCSVPVGLDVDPVAARLFVGCADAGAPRLLVLNANDGALVATLPIGPGNQGVRWHAPKRLIYAWSAASASVAVMKQATDAVTGADTYWTVEAAFTAPGARSVAVDVCDPVASGCTTSGTLYTVAPAARYDPHSLPTADNLGLFAANAVTVTGLPRLLTLKPGL